MCFVQAGGRKPPGFNMYRHNPPTAPFITIFTSLFLATISLSEIIKPSCRSWQQRDTPGSYRGTPHQSRRWQCTCPAGPAHCKYPCRCCKRRLQCKNVYVSSSVHDRERKDRQNGKKQQQQQLKNIPRAAVAKPRMEMMENCILIDVVGS